MFYFRFILVCSLALGHVTLAAKVPRAVYSQWEVCSGKPLEIDEAPVDVLPTWKLSDDNVVDVPTDPLKDSILTVHGVCPTDSSGKFGVRIAVDKIPIFDTEAEAGDPDEPLSDSDDVEHISLYFANEDLDCDKSGFGIPCHRITEIRFNRFLQYNIRLLSRPYKVLKESGFTKPEINTEALEGSKTWKGDITFEVDLLPKDLKYVAAFIIDPTQEINMDRYHSEYRLYNHPISVIDLQVVTSYKDLTKGQESDSDSVDNIVRTEDNANYSSYWDGL